MVRILMSVYSEGRWYKGNAVEVRFNLLNLLLVTKVLGFVFCFFFQILE